MAITRKTSNRVGILSSKKLKVKGNVNSKKIKSNYSNNINSKNKSKNDKNKI